MPGPYIPMNAARATALALARGRFTPEGSERIDPNRVGADTAQLARIMLRPSR
jgi:hypothetical protein